MVEQSLCKRKGQRSRLCTSILFFNKKIRSRSRFHVYCIPIYKWDMYQTQVAGARVMLYTSTITSWCHKAQDYMTKRRWDNLRNGYPVQGQEARELHRLAGVPEGPCGLDELQQFQDHLGTEYQLPVMCMAKPFMLIF